MLKVPCAGERTQRSQNMHDYLLSQGAPPAPGTTHDMAGGDSKGAEEKETRNPTQSPYEEQEDGEDVGI